MRKIVFVIMSCSFLLFSEVNNYELELIKKIDTGSEVGQIGWESNPIGGGYTSPRIFAVGKDSNIYIPDDINKRICVFNSSLILIKNIVVENYTKFIAGSRKIKIQTNGNLTTISRRTFSQINSNGEYIFSFLKKNIPAIYGGFYPIGDYIFFYDKNNGNILSMDKDGVIYRSRETLELLHSVSESSSTSRAFNTNGNNSDVKSIILNNTLLTADPDAIENYYENKKLTLNTRSIPHSMLNIKTLGNRQIIDYDDSGHSYWRAIDRENDRDIIYIYSVNGLVIDAFYYEDYGINGSKEISIAPNGDIYFMERNKDFISFYVIRKKW